MSFERYFHAHPESRYWQRPCTCQSTSQQHTQGCPLYYSMQYYNDSSDWMHRTFPSHPTPHSHSMTQLSTQTYHASFSHPVRLQIPPYLRPGMTNLPTLAPGGGAEVLPAGLFLGSEGMGADPGANWYTNNRLIPTMFNDDLTSYGQRNTPPNRNPVSVIESNHTDYDYDYTRIQGLPQPPSTMGLSTSMSSGIVNSQHPFTSAQSATLGMGLGTDADVNAHTIPLPSLSHPLGPSQSLPSVQSLGNLPLPLYSRSGLDLLSIFAHIASRPNPLISLGPIDLSSSFVVVDSRRYDQPIIYCSPGFCTLTGYEEQDVFGRNCRFLQNPQGRQEKGEWRRWTSNEAVGYLKKCLSEDSGGADEGASSDTFAADRETGSGSGGGRECQISITNYRKGGEAFMNLVTVIPIIQDGNVIFHIGFQADLGEQSMEILTNIKNGANLLMPDSSFHSPPHHLSSVQQQPPSISTPASNSSGRVFTVGERGGFGSRQNMISAPCMSRNLETLIEDPGFMKKYPLGEVGTNSEAPSLSRPSTNHNRNHFLSSINPLEMSADPHTSDLIAPKHASGTGMGTQTQNHPLSLLLLSYIPDFIHVVSLKGTFLYVSPSVKRVLGWDPEDLVGGSSGLDSSSLGNLGSVGMDSEDSVLDGELRTEGAGVKSLGLADICHPGDIMPLLRELKESSTTRSSNPNGLYHQGNDANDPRGGRWDEGSGKPRPVDLLFRARVKPSHSDFSRFYSPSSHDTPKYVWVECRGRLYVEPGKGRKVIILCGRAKEMMNLTWGKVECAGGVSAPAARPFRFPPRKPHLADRSMSGSGMRKGNMGTAKGDNSRARKGKYRAEAEPEAEKESQTEFWGTLTHSSGSFLVVGKGVRDVLGWEPSELIGKQVFQYIVDDQIDNENVREENESGGLGVGVDRLGRRMFANGACKSRMRQKVQDALKGMVFDTAKRRVKAGMEVLPRRILCRMVGQSTSLSSAPATSVQGMGMRENAEQTLNGVIAVNVELVLYSSAADPDILNSKQTISPAPIIYQIRLISSPSYLPPSSLTYYSPTYPSMSTRTSKSYSRSLLVSALNVKAPTPAGRPIYHPLSESLFVEFEISRRSSWQYELQQLRYTNEKLREEIKEMQARDRNRDRKVVNRHMKTTTTGMGPQEIESRRIHTGMEDSMLDR